jgi:hypothetical protein
MLRFDPIIVFLVCVGCGGARVTGRAGEPVDILEHPEAQAVGYDTSVTISFEDGEFRLTLLDRYDISGIVVARQKFSSGWSAKLAPVDLSLAWGEITTPEKAKYVKYKHSGRWYHYWIAADSPVREIDVIEHSCNCHVIPANKNVMLAARAVKKNAVVRLAGFLVNVDGKYQGGDYWWNTSRSRSDTGDASCEVFYVTCVQIGNDLYE